MIPPRYAEVTCSCTHRFEAPEALKGGLTNCPKCGTAVRVPGGFEPVFWVLLGLGFAGVLGIGGALWAFAGMTAGLIALGIGAAIIAAVVLAS